MALPKLMKLRTITNILNVYPLSRMFLRSEAVVKLGDLEWEAASRLLKNYVGAPLKAMSVKDRG